MRLNLGKLESLADVAAALRELVNQLNNWLSVWQTRDVVWSGGSYAANAAIPLTVSLPEAHVGDVVLAAANDTRLSAAARVVVDGSVAVTLVVLESGTFLPTNVKVRVWQ